MLLDRDRVEHVVDTGVAGADQLGCPPLPEPINVRGSTPWSRSDTDAHVRLVPNLGKHIFRTLSIRLSIAGARRLPRCDAPANFRERKRDVACTGLTK